MKTKNEILDELYETQFVDKYCREICVNFEDIEDAIGTVWLAVCELDEKRLQKWYDEGGINKVRAIVSGIINRQLRSTKSKFYYQYVLKDCRNITKSMANDNTYEWEGSYEM